MKNPRDLDLEHPADAASPDYLARVNRAIDYILAHLDRPQSLDEVAQAAHFSPFHFHRVFQAIVGETPAQFTRRLRLEKALRSMCYAPGRPLTEVALDAGFASSSDFSRAFRQRYGVPPSAFDVEGWRRERRRTLQDLVESADASLHVKRLPRGENPDGFRVTLCEVPARRMAYRRVLNPFRPDVVERAAGELVAWARARGLEQGAWFGYMWDDPDVVALEDCRYDVAVCCPAAYDGPAPERGGLHDFPALVVAEVSMDGGIDLEMRLLDWLYRTWLPDSGWLPDDQPCFEAWEGLPFAHGTERFTLSIQLPVRR